MMITKTYALATGLFARPLSAHDVLSVTTRGDRSSALS